MTKNKTDWRWVYHAAGILGWPIDGVMHASLPELILALEGRAMLKGGAGAKKGAIKASLKQRPLDLSHLMAAYPDEK